MPEQRNVLLAMMNAAALLQGGVFRVLRTARAVFNAAEDSSSRPEDAGEPHNLADFSFRCGMLSTRVCSC